MLLFLTLLRLQRMRKIKPFKLADVTRILNPDERQKMLTGAVNRILAAESESAALWRLNVELRLARRQLRVYPLILGVDISKRCRCRS